MRVFSLAPILLGFVAAAPLNDTLSDVNNPIPTCDSGSMTTGTCCMNDWIYVTVLDGKFEGYVCGYSNTGTDPKKCKSPALALCCTETKGLIVPHPQGGDDVFTPIDFRCDGLNGDPGSVLQLGHLADVKLSEPSLARIVFDET